MDIFPEDYRVVTDKMPVGMSRKVPHKHCSSSACLRIENGVEGLQFYCFKCKEYTFVSTFNSPAERARRSASFDAYREAKASQSFDVPLDFSHSIAPKGLAWLGAGGWTLDMIARYNVGWSDKLSRVIIPIVSNCIHQGYVARAVESWQQPKYLEKVKPGVMWDSSPLVATAYPLGATAYKSCVVCEDILSAGRCGEIIKAYSLLGTSLDTKFLNTFRQYDVVYLWLDPDKAGRDGVKSMINRLRLFSEVIIVLSDKDPKCLTTTKIKELLCRKC